MADSHLKIILIIFQCKAGSPLYFSCWTWEREVVGGPLPGGLLAQLWAIRQLQTHTPTMILGELEAEVSSGVKKGRGWWLAICGRAICSMRVARPGQDTASGPTILSLDRTEQVAPPSFPREEVSQNSAPCILPVVGWMLVSSLLRTCAFITWVEGTCPCD